MNKLSIHLIEAENIIFEIAIVDDTKKEVLFKNMIKLYNSDLKNPDDLVTKINHFLNGKGKKPLEVNFAVTSNKIITYPIVLPKMSKKALEKSVGIELETNFLNYKDNYCVRTNYTTNGNNNVCYAVLFPNSFIKLFSVIGSKLGMFVNNITTSGVAGFKYLQKNSDFCKKMKTGYLLTIFENTSFLSLIKNGTLFNTDIINHGLNDFNYTVQKFYDVEYDDSVLLRNYGKVHDLEITDRERQYIYFTGIKEIVNEVKKIIISNDIGCLSDGFDSLYMSTYDQDIRVIRRHLKRNFSFLVDTIESDNLNKFKDQVLIGVGSRFNNGDYRFFNKKKLFKR